MHPYFTATLKEQKQEDKENLPDTGEENIVTHRCIDSDLPRSPAKGNVFMDQEDSQNAIVPIVTEQDDVIVSKQKDDVTVPLVKEQQDVRPPLICEPSNEILAPVVFEKEEDGKDLPFTGEEDIVTQGRVDSDLFRNPAKENVLTDQDDNQNAIVPIVAEKDDVIVSKQKDDVTLELGDNVVIQLICEPDDDFLAPFVFEQEEDIEDLPVTGKEDIVTHRQVDSTQSRNPAKGNFVTAHNDEAEFMDVDGLEDIISAMVIIFVCKTLTHFYFKCFYAFIETSCLPKIHAGFKIISFLLFL